MCWEGLGAAVDRLVMSGLGAVLDRLVMSGLGMEQAHWKQVFAIIAFAILKQHLPNWCLMSF